MPVPSRGSWRMSPIPVCCTNTTAWNAVFCTIWIDWKMPPRYACFESSCSILIDSTQFIKERIVTNSRLLRKALLGWLKKKKTIPKPRSLHFGSHGKKTDPWCDVELYLSEHEFFTWFLIETRAEILSNFQRRGAVTKAYLSVGNLEHLVEDVLCHRWEVNGRWERYVQENVYCKYSRTTRKLTLYFVVNTLRDGVPFNRVRLADLMRRPRY